MSKATKTTSKKSVKLATKKSSVAKSAKKIAKAKQTSTKVAPKISLWQRLLVRRRDFLRRRPHRSFRLTKRIDTKRSLKMEGYFSFSTYVWREIKRGWSFFLALGTLLVVIFLASALLIPQMSYNNLRDALNETAGQANFGGSLYRAGLLFLSSISSSSVNPAGDQTQRVLMVLIVILTWLTVVYFLRHQLANKPIKLRQALYSSGAPLVPTIALVFFAVLQLVPMGIYAIIFSAAKNTELIKGGVSDMLAVLVGVLLLALTLYWLVSTIIALVIVTISGTGPIKAWRVADDMVVGRRGRIVRRIVWHLAQLATLWVVVALPIIWLENELAAKWDWLTKVPIVPFVILILTIVTILWSSAYVYLLYRRILDDDAKPA